jgi:hypothetical protein
MRLTLAALALSTSALVPACSEPVPQSPDAAYYLNHSQHDGSACSIFDFTIQVGSVNNTERTTVTDGADGTKVSCQILNAAAPFAVSGIVDDSAGKTGSYFRIDIPKIDKTATKDSPATGSVTYAALKTASNPLSGTCNFYFEAASSEAVASGKIWVAFDCPSVSGQPGTCAVQKGVAVFENCLTESTL